MSYSKSEISNKNKFDIIPINLYEFYGKIDLSFKNFYV